MPNQHADVRHRTCPLWTVLAREGLAVAAEERRLRQRREEAALLAEADRQRPAGGRSPTCWPSTRTAASTSALALRSVQLRPARHDERPRVERVRRDERDRHRVEAAHEDRPAVREVVRGRAGRRRADHPVARDDAELLPADRPAELDHPPERRARGDDVVDRGERLAVEPCLERRLLDRRGTRRRRRARDPPRAAPA